MTGIEVHAVTEPPGLRRGDTAAAGVANWLYLAAAPTFAMMALLTALGGSPMDRFCFADPGVPLGGMVPMYLLMSAFHTPAWLRLIFGRRD
jgi:hypothetical protein